MLTRLDAWRPVVGASVCALPCDLEHRSRPCGLTPARSPNPAPLALPPTSLAPSLCRPRSTLHPPSIVHRPRSAPPSAVCGPPSTLYIRSFVPHSLTVCPPPRNLESPSSAIGCLPSIVVHRPRSAPPSAVCRPHSFIRSPFVDGLPSPPKSRKPTALRRPRSAIHIRLFVPHSLTVCPPPASKAHPPPPAVRRLRSAVYLAVRRLLSLPLPQQRLIWPRPGRFTGKTIPPAQGVEQGR
jgi:hypothetical protein